MLPESPEGSLAINKPNLSSIRGKILGVLEKDQQQQLSETFARSQALFDEIVMERECIIGELLVDVYQVQYIHNLYGLALKNDQILDGPFQKSYPTLYEKIKQFQSMIPLKDFQIDPVIEDVFYFMNLRSQSHTTGVSLIHLLEDGYFEHVSQQASIANTLFIQGGTYDDPSSIARQSERLIALLSKFPHLRGLDFSMTNPHLWREGLPLRHISHLLPNLRVLNSIGRGIGPDQGEEYQSFFGSLGQLRHLGWTSLHADAGVCLDFEAIFAGLPFLRSLDLNYELPGNPLIYELLGSLPKLNYLNAHNLDVGNMKQVDSLVEGISRVDYLNLGYNALARISHEHAHKLFPAFARLKRLSLESNHLEELPFDLFELLVEHYPGDPKWMEYGNSLTSEQRDLIKKYSKI